MKIASNARRLLSLLFTFWMVGSSAQADLRSEVRQGNFSLSKGSLALGGYDPVSYFKNGPAKGSKDITHEVLGVTYRFASEANRSLFKADPEKYEPEYSGWCAWAMYDGGGRTKSNPMSYTITDGKLYMFYDTFLADTLKFWNKAAAKSSEAALIREADKNWRGQVGG